MAHGERQGHAAIGQRHLLAAADVVIALPDVQIGVADAAMGDFDQHLGALGLGRGEFDFLKRLSVFDDGPGAHGGGLLLAFGGWIARGCERSSGGAVWRQVLPRLGRLVIGPAPAPNGVHGAVAQLGERLNGIQEVRGSIPLGSTILPHKVLLSRMISDLSALAIRPAYQ